MNRLNIITRKLNLRFHVKSVKKWPTLTQLIGLGLSRAPAKGMTFSSSKNSPADMGPSRNRRSRFKSFQSWLVLRNPWAVGEKFSLLSLIVGSDITSCLITPQLFGSVLELTRFWRENYYHLVAGDLTSFFHRNLFDKCFWSFCFKSLAVKN